jgi:hypothetical protein
VNVPRVVLASVGGFVAYFAFGAVVFGVIPQLREEFATYPSVYRSQEAMVNVMPVGMAAMFVAVVALAVLYALLYRGGSGLVEGARFGALIGLFAVCAFVLHNYVNLNIGVGLTLQQATVYFLEWTLTGTVVGLLYRPKSVR